MDTGQQSTETYGRQNEVSQISKIIDEGNKPAPVKTDEDAVVADPLAEEKADQTVENADSSATSSDEDSNVGDDDNPLAAQQAEEAAKPVTLKELAESMDIEAKELYDVEITVGKDEVMSLGALKDAFKENKVNQAKYENFESEKLSHDNETMVARRQIQQLVEVGVKTNSLHPEVLAQLETIHGDNVQRERTALLNVMPEWEDAAVRTTEYAEMTEILGEYGFTRAEVEGVLDHRLLKFARDMARRENQIRKAKPGGNGKVPADLGKGRKRPVPNKLREKLAKAKAPQASRADKMGAITELLNP